MKLILPCPTRGWPPKFVGHPCRCAEPASPPLERLSLQRGHLTTFSPDHQDHPTLPRAAPSSPPAQLTPRPQTPAVTVPFCLRFQAAAGHPRHPDPFGLLRPGAHLPEGELAGAALREGGAGLQRAVPAAQRR